MKVLRVIGAFFARIGRWIRDTAWVQPLLIVGGIFGIIFSIIPIKEGIEKLLDEGNPALNYYKNYKLSLEDTNKGEGESVADGLFRYIEDIQEANGDKSKLNKSDVNKYGEKFFLAFVQENCAGCESGYPGFNTLQKNWNKMGLTINDNLPFKIHTIFIDTIDDEDIDSENLFNDYILTRYTNVFEEAVQTAQESEYCINQATGKITDSTYYKDAEKMLDEGGFQSPTTFLVSLEDAKLGFQYGISEVLFNYDPKNGEEGNFKRAETLCDAWNHEGIFSSNYKKN